MFVNVVVLNAKNQGYNFVIREVLKQKRMKRKISKITQFVKSLLKSWFIFSLGNIFTLII